MIYIVIAVHNRQAYTLDCLACLARQTVIEKQVIVVDDGSSDGTSDQIRRQFPDTVLLTGDGSLWWAGATNLGIRYVLSTCTPGIDDFILTLNDDTKVEPDYLASLLTAYHRNKPCLIGSVSVDVTAPHRLVYAGTGLNLFIPHIDNWARTRFSNRYTSLLEKGAYLESDSLPGRGMFIPLPVFSCIGLLDEQRFRHHMADLDFSLSARKAGFRLVLSTASVVQEYTQATGINLMRPMPIRHFLEALSSIRSPINGNVRYHFALKHSPLRHLYFTLDMMRIVAGYIIRQLNKPGRLT